MAHLNSQFQEKNVSGSLCTNIALLAHLCLFFMLVFLLIYFFFVSKYRQRIPRSQAGTCVITHKLVWFTSNIWVINEAFLVFCISSVPASEQVTPTVSLFRVILFCLFWKFISNIYIFLVLYRPFCCLLWQWLP